MLNPVHAPLVQGEHQHSMNCRDIIKAQSVGGHAIELSGRGRGIELGSNKWIARTIGISWGMVCDKYRMEAWEVKAAESQQRTRVLEVEPVEPECLCRDGIEVPELGS